MTKGELWASELAGMPDNTELEIHLDHSDGSEDFTLEPIGPVSGISPDQPPWFTFRVGELVSECGLCRRTSGLRSPPPRARPAK